MFDFLKSLLGSAGSKPASGAANSGGALKAITQGVATFAKNQAKPFVGLANSAAQSIAPNSRFAAYTQKAYSGLQPRPASAASMPGLSPSQLLGMAGKSPQQIQQAHQQAQQQQADAQNPKPASTAQNAAQAALSLTGLATAAVLGIKAVKNFAGSIVDANEPLKKYNGAIAAAYARLEAGNIGRDVQTAHATAGSTSTLADSFDELLDEVRPIKDATITALNLAAIMATGIGKLLVLMLKLTIVGPAVIELLKKIEDLLKPKAIGTPELEFIRNLAASKFLVGAKEWLKPLPPMK